MELNLQLFAKDGPTGQKTEEPTAKKLKDARENGQVAKSQDLGNAVMLLCLFTLLKIWIGRIGEGMLEIFPEAYNKMASAVMTELNTTVVAQWVMEFIISILKIIWPILLLGVVVAFLINRVQFSWMVTTKPMQPKLSKINPISGFKRLFSVRTLMKTGVSIATIIVIATIVYSTIKDEWALLYLMYDMEIAQVIALVGDVVIRLGIKIAAVMCVIGLLDYAFQKWKNKQDNMMSKQDVKDEYKNSEGDPQIKGKIKQKQREVSQRRMMQSVPKADVIITNPTHYAVAIKYERDSQGAPVVVAKGTDYLAAKIKETAKENGVEIVENRALARMLYHNVEIGDEIPPELYQAVAEVLAYVYRLKHTA
jgi:flagellar biosynthetic protein FlhB